MGHVDISDVAEDDNYERVTVQGVWWGVPAGGWRMDDRSILSYLYKTHLVAVVALTDYDQAVVDASACAVSPSPVRSRGKPYPR